MNPLTHFLTCCLSGRSRTTRPLLSEKSPVFTPYTDTPTTPSKKNSDEDEEALANSIIETLYTAPLNSPTLHRDLSSLVHSTSWTETLAVFILNKLRQAIEASRPMGKAMQHAIDHVKSAAEATWEWVKQHPKEMAALVATVIALGVLIYFGVPFVMSALGFARTGIRAGSWAARWQRTYAGFVSKESWFSFWQRVGATPKSLEAGGELLI